MLFPLETSIPTAFILFLLLTGYGFPLFTHCLFNLLGDTSAQGGSTCANRMLRMKEAADGLHFGRVDPRFLLSGHLLSHSNSFGFEMEKDAAGCRAYHLNYIVGGFVMKKAIVITLGVIIGVTGVLAICAHLADAARLALYVPEDDDDEDIY